MYVMHYMWKANNASADAAGTHTEINNTLVDAAERYYKANVAMKLHA